MPFCGGGGEYRGILSHALYHNRMELTFYTVYGQKRFSIHIMNKSDCVFLEFSIVSYLLAFQGKKVNISGA